MQNNSLKVIAVCYFLFVASPVFAQQLYGQPKEKLIIGGTEITVEIANTPEALAVGLMNRSYLQRESGMLFIFEKEKPVTMWMKNTKIPLDMIFIKSDGTITRIAKNTKPLSTVPIGSDGNVKYVLELNAGMAKVLGLQKGDVIDDEKYFK